MQTLPSVLSRFVDQAGKIVTPFIQYLQQFTIAPPSFDPIAVGVSPFEYIAREPGNIAITGGTITNVTLIRGVDSLSFGSATNRIIPVAINDVLEVTYSVLPTLTFIPSYGQNTTS